MRRNLLGPSVLLLLALGGGTLLAVRAAYPGAGDEDDPPAGQRHQPERSREGDMPAGVVHQGRAGAVVGRGLRE